MHMPSDWEPPVPAWSARFSAGSGPLVTAYLATQLCTGEATQHWRTINSFLARDDGPDNVEQARFTDRRGCSTAVSIAYWTNAAKYQRWQTTSTFSAWWHEPERLNGPNGYFREVLTVPVERFETLFSSQNAAGAANTGQTLQGPIREHNYWGGMRDRIPASAHDEFASRFGRQLPQLGATATHGKRLRVDAPENLAVIRSGQDWTRCDAHELATYNESVLPYLIEGMNFLSAHPEDTGCCDMRFAQEVDADGAAGDRSFGLGYFLTLGHLERWAETHPTHLAIFNSFLEMARKHELRLNLRLWHEVAVLPVAHQVFEYINCHPETGLLPYFPARTF